MPSASELDRVLTKQQRRAELAKQSPHSRDLLRQRIRDGVSRPVANP